MNMRMRVVLVAAAVAAGFSTLNGQQGASTSNQDSFRFKSGVELVNVTAAVTDSNGRFVSGLSKDDFIVYEDDVLQKVTQFSAERVPVSLGIALDTSGSMVGEKIAAARTALDRFLYDLLDPEDEIFLYRFSDVPMLLQGWTSERSLLARALGRITPNGGTAMYDTIAEAIPMATEGQHQKKALVVISDGNDTASHIGSREVKQLIRESEVLVYAVGIDGESVDLLRRPPRTRTPPPRWPPSFPLPIPGGGRGRPGGGFFPAVQGPIVLGQRTGGWYGGAQGDDHVNVGALRDLTDDSGGRTEVIRNIGDLDPATAGIADELSKQYYLGYTSSGDKDGHWHAIRVEVRNRGYHVRARRGYVAN